MYIHVCTGGAAGEPVPLKEPNTGVVLVAVLAECVVLEAGGGEGVVVVGDGVHGTGHGELDLERTGGVVPRLVHHVEGVEHCFLRKKD